MALIKVINKNDCSSIKKSNVYWPTAKHVGDCLICEIAVIYKSMRSCQTFKLVRL